MSSDNESDPPKEWHAPAIYAKHTGTPKGRGVFAARDFKEDEGIEACPVVLLRGPIGQLAEPVRVLVFDWTKLVGATMPNLHALALGFGSLYNHANPSNLRYSAIEAQRLIVFVADRDIKAGEELTINYSGEMGVSTSDDDWWPRRHAITMV